MTKFNKHHSIFNRSETIKSHSFKTPRHQHSRVKPPVINKGDDSFLFLKNQHGNRFYHCPCGKGGPIKNYSDEKRHKSSQYHKDYLRDQYYKKDRIISELIHEIHSRNFVKNKLQNIHEQLSKLMKENEEFTQIQDEKIAQLKNKHNEYLFDHRFSFM